ncbi:hypothetical protein PYW07_001871 [Mythimna separata]|uniref:Rab-GAP TBC domain-containing protein n=1 Tax=Mythimna separata TaxID=271217 RepID=A0AAD7YT21_MYTSE|nr:hypothetical protein PYW07_001871 [Mythimna separata]
MEHNSADSSPNSPSKKFPEVTDYQLDLPAWSVDSLKTIAIQQRLPRPRSLAWAILLNALPPPNMDIVSSLKTHRNFYNDLSDKLSMDPRAVIGDDPLSQDDESVWKQHFCDNELKTLILQDVVRTFPEELYFRDKEVQDLMVRILFFWARSHANVGYRQGMHEILAPVLFELYLDRKYAPDDLGEKLKFILKEDCLEHDSYMLFSAIMKGIERFYTTGDIVPTSCGRLPSSKISHNPNEVIRYLDKVREEYLVPLDLELSLHLVECNISMELFGIRWLRLLFGREFPRSEIPNLWGFLFADGPAFPNLHYVIVAMLVSMRNTLLDPDPGVILSALMRPVCLCVGYVCALALHQHTCIIMYYCSTGPRPRRDPVGADAAVLDPDPGVILSALMRPVCLCVGYVCALALHQHTCIIMYYCSTGPRPRRDPVGADAAVLDPDPGVILSALMRPVCLCVGYVCALALHQHTCIIMYYCSTGPRPRRDPVGADAAVLDPDPGVILSALMRPVCLCVGYVCALALHQHTCIIMYYCSTGPRPRRDPVGADAAVLDPDPGVILSALMRPVCLCVGYVCALALHQHTCIIMYYCSTGPRPRRDPVGADAAVLDPDPGVILSALMRPVCLCVGYVCALALHQHTCIIMYYCSTGPRPRRDPVGADAAVLDPDPGVILSALMRPVCLCVGYVCALALHQHTCIIMYYCSTGPRPRRDPVGADAAVLDPDPGVILSALMRPVCLCVGYVCALALHQHTCIIMYYCSTGPRPRRDPVGADAAVLDPDPGVILSALMRPVCLCVGYVCALALHQHTCIIMYYCSTGPRPRRDPVGADAAVLDPDPGVILSALMRPVCLCVGYVCALALHQHTCIIMYYCSTGPRPRRDPVGADAAVLDPDPGVILSALMRPVCLCVGYVCALALHQHTCIIMYYCSTGPRPRRDPVGADAAVLDPDPGVILSALMRPVCLCVGYVCALALHQHTCIIMYYCSTGPRPRRDPVGADAAVLDPDPGVILSALMRPVCLCVGYVCALALHQHTCIIMYYCSTGPRPRRDPVGADAAVLDPDPGVILSALMRPVCLCVGYVCALALHQHTCIIMYYCSTGPRPRRDPVGADAAVLDPDPGVILSALMRPVCLCVGYVCALALHQHTCIIMYYCSTGPRPRRDPVGADAAVLDPDPGVILSALMRPVCLCVGYVCALALHQHTCIIMYYCSTGPRPRRDPVGADAAVLDPDPGVILSALMRPVCLCVGYVCALALHQHTCIIMYYCSTGPRPRRDPVGADAAVLDPDPGVILSALMRPVCLCVGYVCALALHQHTCIIMYYCSTGPRPRRDPVGADAAVLDPDPGVILSALMRPVCLCVGYVCALALHQHTCIIMYYCSTGPRPRRDPVGADAAVLDPDPGVILSALMRPVCLCVGYVCALALHQHTCIIMYYCSTGPRPRRDPVGADAAVLDPDPGVILSALMRPVCLCVGYVCALALHQHTCIIMYYCSTGPRPRRDPVGADAAVLDPDPGVILSALMRPVCLCVGYVCALALHQHTCIIMYYCSTGPRPRRDPVGADAAVLDPDPGVILSALMRPVCLCVGYVCALALHQHTCIIMYYCSTGPRPRRDPVGADAAVLDPDPGVILSALMRPVCLCVGYVCALALHQHTCIIMYYCSTGPRPRRDPVGADAAVLDPDPGVILSALMRPVCLCVGYVCALALHQHTCIIMYYCSTGPRPRRDPVGADAAVLDPDPGVILSALMRPVCLCVGYVCALALHQHTCIIMYYCSTGPRPRRDPVGAHTAI